MKTRAMRLAILPEAFATTVHPPIVTDSMSDNTPIVTDAALACCFRCGVIRQSPHKQPNSGVIKDSDPLLGATLAG
jgi:hypothetical protein